MAFIPKTWSRFISAIGIMAMFLISAPAAMAANNFLDNQSIGSAQKVGISQLPQNIDEGFVDVANYTGDPDFSDGPSDDHTYVISLHKNELYMVVANPVIQIGGDPKLGGGVTFNMGLDYPDRGIRVDLFPTDDVNIKFTVPANGWVQGTRVPLVQKTFNLDEMLKGSSKFGQYLNGMYFLERDDNPDNTYKRMFERTFVVAKGGKEGFVLQPGGLFYSDVSEKS